MNLGQRIAEKLHSQMTAAQAARATYKVLLAAAKEEGQNPTLEVGIKSPKEPKYWGEDPCWWVGWEAGPYEWAIPASMIIGNKTGRICEPQHSFDLTFYPSEWAEMQKAFVEEQK